MSRKEKIKQKEKKSNSKGKKVFYNLIILLIIATGVGLYGFQNNWFGAINEKEYGADFESKAVPELQILDKEDKSRPIAIMFDNNTNAWPHSSINSAYIVYEMPVEGGETRLMAVFKNSKTVDVSELKQVGPIRSARHYFLDYVLENDAVYVHLGQSPKANSDINTLGIDRINGQNYDTLAPKKGTDTEFWRSKKIRPHNAYTSIKNIWNIVDLKEFRKDLKNNDTLLKYSIAEYELPEELAKDVDELNIQFSSTNKVRYVYNPETKKFTKYAKGQLQKEELSGDNVEAKNIICIKMPVHSIPGDNKGRKDVKTVGEHKGYFLTDGKYIEITAKKDSRTAKTKYLDSNGEEIIVNDGNTHIAIVPTIEGDITIKANPKSTPTPEEVVKDPVSTDEE